jgi:hypothetical protein
MHAVKVKAFLMEYVMKSLLDRPAVSRVVPSQHLQTQLTSARSVKGQASHVTDYVKKANPRKRAPALLGLEAFYAALHTGNFSLV